MASKSLVDIALKLAKQLGANTNKFLGTRTNISFLGKGPKDDLFFQQDINTEALSAFPLSKLLPQIESSMGYLTGGKLNSLPNPSFKRYRYGNGDQELNTRRSRCFKR